LVVFVLMAAFVSCSKSEGSGSGGGILARVAADPRAVYYGKWYNDETSRLPNNLKMEISENEFLYYETTSFGKMEYKARELQWVEVENKVTASKEEFPKGYTLKGVGSGTWVERGGGYEDESEELFARRVFEVFISTDGKKIKLRTGRSSISWVDMFKE